MNNNFSKIVNQLKQFSPQAIILFGSQVKGPTHRNSDFDLLIIKETSEPFNKRITDAHRVLHTNTPVDILVLTPSELQKYKENSSFYQSVLESGKVLYGRI